MHGVMVSTMNTRSGKHRILRQSYTSRDHRYRFDDNDEKHYKKFEQLIDH